VSNLSITVCTSSGISGVSPAGKSTTIAAIVSGWISSRLLRSSGVDGLRIDGFSFSGVPVTSISTIVSSAVFGETSNNLSVSGFPSTDETAGTSTCSIP